MHIKHMHEMIERLTDCTKSAIENDEICVGKYPISDVVDMIKDLNEASYYASIVKAMDEAKKEEEEEEKYMMKRFKEEYGEEDGEKRFYDDWRYASGRFAPKGRGSYEPRRSGRRRGYEEPPYYHIMPEAMEHDPEYWRDMDRKDGKMYYTETMPHHTADMSRTGAMHDMRQESRFDKAKRGYEETKEMHKGNTTEDKQTVMKEAERLVNVGMDAIEEALEGSAPEVINMVKAKMTGRIQKLS